MLKKKQIIGMLEANELVGSIGTFSCQDMNNQNIVVSGILVKRNDQIIFTWLRALILL